MIEKVGVVVPAHNEEGLLGDCLDSLMRASAKVRLPCRVVVALDRCADSSRAVAHRFRSVQTVDLIAGNVGMARAAGTNAALGWAGATSRHRTWLATTDADSVVPADWLARQIHYAALGWEVFVGTVEVADWSMRPRSAQERWSASYQTTDDHRHVHGANFGCTAEAYVNAGGWPPQAAHEDVGLLAALQGRRVLRCAAPQVITSARRDARAAVGFGATLDELAG